MSRLKETWHRITHFLGSSGWFNLRFVLFVVVTLFFLFLLLWGEPITHFISGTENESIQAVLTPSSLSGTPVEIPPEVISINRQINLDVFGAVILVLIILVVTMTNIIQKKNKPPRSAPSVRKKLKRAK